MCNHSSNDSDHISTEGGHAEHVLVTGTRWMPHLLINKFLRFRRCPVTFAQGLPATIYIVQCFRLKVIAEHVDDSTAHRSIFRLDRLLPLQ